MGCNVSQHSQSETSSRNDGSGGGGDSGCDGGRTTGVASENPSRHSMSGLAHAMRNSDMATQLDGEARKSRSGSGGAGQGSSRSGGGRKRGSSDPSQPALHDANGGRETAGTAATAASSAAAPSTTCAASTGATATASRQTTRGGIERRGSAADANLISQRLRLRSVIHNQDPDDRPENVDAVFQAQLIVFKETKGRGSLASSTRQPLLSEHRGSFRSTSPMHSSALYTPMHDTRSTNGDVHVSLPASLTMSPQNDGVSIFLHGGGGSNATTGSNGSDTMIGSSAGFSSNVTTSRANLLSSTECVLSQDHTVSSLLSKVQSLSMPTYRLAGAAGNELSPRNDHHLQHQYQHHSASHDLNASSSKSMLPTIPSSHSDSVPHLRMTAASSSSHASTKTDSRGDRSHHQLTDGSSSVRSTPPSSRSNKCAVSLPPLPTALGASASKPDGNTADVRKDGQSASCRASEASTPMHAACAAEAHLEEATSALVLSS